MMGRLTSASESAFSSLYPWLRPFTAIAIVFHLAFWAYNQITGSSEPFWFRLAAIVALLPYTIPSENLPAQIHKLIRQFVLISFLIAAPCFLFASLLYELATDIPKVNTLATRQYELLGAIAFYFLVCPDRKLATLLLTTSFGVIFAFFKATTNLDFSLLLDTSSSLLSAYWIVAFTGLIIALRRSQELKDKSTALGSAGTSITHELRTPLLSIRARAQALLRSSSREQEQNARAILEEVDSANTLIDMFLVKANPTNSQTLETTFNVSQAVEEAVSRYPYKSTKQKDCISSYLQYDMSLHGPYELFLHVLFNLLKNAFEHLDLNEGQIEIRTELDNNFRLILKDNGRGVDESDLDDVFNPFFSTSANYGAGVGLAFCRSTIEDQYGGAINLSSEQGVHTTVVIELPASTS